VAKGKRMGRREEGEEERELKDAQDARLDIFSVDLINLDRVDPEFRTLIKEGGRVIYEQH
jgi:hypothetical protein